MGNNKKIGSYGEKMAVKYLIINNYAIKHVNFRCKLGEIDIIAEKDNIIVFIEVKTRKNKKYGYPCESVTKRKQQKIIKTAQFYINKNNVKDKQFRFDVIEIFMGNSNNINHICNAFW